MFRDAASPEPEPYSGDPGGCSGFLLQAELAFGCSPRTFFNDVSRILVLVGKLCSCTLVEAYFSGNLLQYCPYVGFLGDFKKTFAHPYSEGSTAQRLLILRQVRQSVADYLIDFHKAAVEAGWADQVLQGLFFQLLNEKLKDQLVSWDEPGSFEELASLALCIDNQLREREEPPASKSVFALIFQAICFFL